MHNRAAAPARDGAKPKAASRRAQSGPNHISRVSVDVSTRDDESASPTASSGHERLVKERGGDATLHPSHDARQNAEAPPRTFSLTNH